MKGSAQLSNDNTFGQGHSNAASSDSGTTIPSHPHTPTPPPSWLRSYNSLYPVQTGNFASVRTPSLNTGQLTLGRTLPSLLDTACGRSPNAQALNQWCNHQCQSLSNQALRQEAEEIALGLLALGVEKGDRIPLVMPNRLDFCRVDMGCLLAGLVDVPIDLTQTIENILFILQHSQAKVMVIGNLDLLQQLVPYFWEASALKHIVVAEVPVDWYEVRAALTRQSQQPVPGTQPAHSEDRTAKAIPSPGGCLQMPQLLRAACTPAPCLTPAVPSCIQLLSLDEVQQQGRQSWTVSGVEALRRAIAPHDLATIIYIASETRRPKGVMLTHENITANVLAAFTSYPNLQSGAAEVALLFLPLTHIFARVFLYGHLAYGHTVHLSDPNHLMKHLHTVRPTLMITVPRLLEKVYERLLERGKRLKGFDRAVFDWAVKLAQHFDVEHSPQGLYALQRQLADRLVFRRWRDSFGDRLKAIISGGAALSPNLVNFFTAAGLPVLQGYGLTETSGVVCYTRGAANRAGTVGRPIAGVAMTLAADGEILIKAPFVTAGYYRDAAATRAALDADGWLHTGDLGTIDADGFLTIAGVKKPLFKLATGKYVSPLPLEQAVMRSPLAAYAIAVGANRKFCGMLIAPNLEELGAIAQSAQLATDTPNWWQHPTLIAHYQTLIDAANCHLPYWSTVRQFRLLDPTRPPQPILDNHGLLPNGQLNRPWALTHFAIDIQALYEQPSHASTPTPPLTPTCPINAQSLTHH